MKKIKDFIIFLMSNNDKIRMNQYKYMNKQTGKVYQDLWEAETTLSFIFIYATSKKDHCRS